VEADAKTELLSRARQVLERCDALARCSEEADRLTRPYGTASLRAAQDLVSKWMTAAGLIARRDAVGNLIGRYDPGVPGSRTLLLGSHLDSVRDAGKYDGPLGVLVALTVVEQLAKNGGRPDLAIEVVAFADEEGLRFHTTYLGSRALAGSLDSAILDHEDRDGVTLRDAIRAFGGDPDAIASAAFDPKQVLGYIEVHIEQGPVLEARDLPVGLVAAIAGQTRAAVTFTGEAGHAGTVPMSERRDALNGAAEFALAVEAQAKAVEGLVATVGQLTLEPGASNVIPGEARLSLDIRHAEDAVRDLACNQLREHARRIADSRSLALTWENKLSTPAVHCDASLTRRIEAAITSLGLPVARLTSGAGHDAVALAPRVPVAMLFVRCGQGISHNPAEVVTAADVAASIAVLDQVLEHL
jgi:allantoate deiminase